MNKFTIGSDPEAFLVNKTTGEVVSAARFTKGTKELPEDLGDGYAIMNDNVLIEGNLPPARSKHEFVSNMSNLHALMSERAATRLAKLVNSDCQLISDFLADTREGKEFGCSSFLDAWNDFVEIATPQLKTNYRPAGCHIHMGFDDERREFKIALIRAMDMFLTVPHITNVTGVNFRTDNMYGILGAARITPYGVEHRSLGGSAFNPKYFEWIYDAAETAFAFAQAKEEQILALPSISSYRGTERLKIVADYYNKLK